MQFHRSYEIEDVVHGERLQPVDAWNKQSFPLYTSLHVGKQWKRKISVAMQRPAPSIPCPIFRVWCKQMMHELRAMKFCQLTGGPRRLRREDRDPGTPQHACVHVCTYICACLCLCLTLEAPDGRQRVNRLYFLPDLILIDQCAALPLPSAGTEVCPWNAPTYPPIHFLSNLGY